MLLVGTRQQKFFELALRQHDNLPKLFAVKLQKLLNISRNVLDVNELAVQINFSRRLLLRQAVAAKSRPLIFRVASDFINLPAQGKFKFNFGLVGRRGLLGTEHETFAPAARTLAVKRKANRVKNRCFAGAGRAVNQEKIFAAQVLFKVKLNRLGVSPKRRHL